MPRILIVEDDVATRMVIEEMLTALDYEVVGQAERARQGVEMVRELKPDLILMDIVMPGDMDGITAAEKIKQEWDIPVVFLTGHGNPEYIKRAKKVEPFGYVMKPFDESEIKAVIEIALYKKEIDKKLKDSHEELIKLNRKLKTEMMEREKSEEKYRSLFENSPIGIATLDEKRNILDFNDAMLNMNGYTREDLEYIGNTGEYYYNSAEREKVTSELSKNGFVKEMEIKLKRKDGTPYDAQLSMRPIEVGGKSLWHAMIQNVSDRRRAEDELKASEEKYRDLVENINDVIYSLDTRGTVNYVSPRIDTLSGYSASEIIGKNMMEFVYRDDRAAVAENFRELTMEGHIQPHEYRLIDKHGETRWIRSSSRLIYQDEKVSGVQGVFTEITQSKRVEEELRHAQKMEAIGTLTGGIAHDYNNLLAIIMGNLSMAQEETEPHSFTTKFLNRIEEASFRARDLTHQLMILSRGGYPMKERGSIQGLLKETPGQVQAHDGIDCVFSIQDDLWPLEHDSSQMHYAISNILMNAVEAMPQGGTVTLQAENQVIEKKGKDSALPLNEGKYVRVSIKDEGGGIPEKHLTKIFDPYFSTKDRGVQKGMGLGLTTAYAVVQKHGGHIMVDSTIGVGTIVTIYLPTTAAENKAPGAKHDDVGAQSTIVNQQSLRGVGPYGPEAPIRSILVMDDEEMLRNLAQMMLERLGHKVETVKDGVEAIETYKKHMDSGQPFDGVILDLTIKGGMGGDQAIRELLKIDPEVKAIVCSGYFNDPVLAHYEEHGFRGAMAKPYQKKDLERVLKKVLDFDTKEEPPYEPQETHDRQSIKSSGQTGEGPAF